MYIDLFIICKYNACTIKCLFTMASINNIAFVTNKCY